MHAALLFSFKLHGLKSDSILNVVMVQIKSNKRWIIWGTRCDKRGPTTAP